MKIPTFIKDNWAIILVYTILFAALVTNSVVTVWAADRRHSDIRDLDCYSQGDLDCNGVTDFHDMLSLLSKYDKK